ncbi:MAG: hypothetical protein WB495_25365 [Xanthobacteraceae bacterium]
MILNKLLAAAAAVVLGFALAHVDDARHGANNGHSANGARKTTAKTTAMAQFSEPRRPTCNCARRRQFFASFT